MHENNYPPCIASFINKEEFSMDKTVKYTGLATCTYTYTDAYVQVATKTKTGTFNKYAF